MTAKSHDAFLPIAESGCMVIADIWGYTRYLNLSELEHANDVLARGFSSDILAAER